MSAVLEHKEEAEEWAKSLLLKVKAIWECERHGYLVDRGDLDAVKKAIRRARSKPPQGTSPDEAEALIRRVAQSMPSVCPGC